LEQELDTKDFYRISRKFIIPLKAIKEIVMYSNSRLKIVLPSYKEDEVVVSREKVSGFKNWIG
jgi:two-component system response regulator LytT